MAKATHILRVKKAPADLTLFEQARQLRIDCLVRGAIASTDGVTNGQSYNPGDAIIHVAIREKEAISNSDLALELAGLNAHSGVRGTETVYFNTPINHDSTGYVDEGLENIFGGMDESGTQTDLITLSGSGPWSLSTMPSGTVTLAAISDLYKVDTVSGEITSATTADLEHDGSGKLVCSGSGYTLEGVVTAEYDYNDTLYYEIEVLPSSTWTYGCTAVAWVLTWQGAPVASGLIDLGGAKFVHKNNDVIPLLGAAETAEGDIVTVSTANWDDLRVEPY